jgi:hypothetical protein
MTSSKSSVLSPRPLQPTKPANLWVSDQLTKSEIALLRQGKRSIADYVQREFPDREALRRACKQIPS